MNASQPQQLPPTFYNAYGQMNTPNEGAVTSMNNIYGALNNGTVNPQAVAASQAYANSLNSAASNPLLGSANAYTSNELAGGDLTSPIVNNYANQAYNSIISQGQNENARTQANYANNGLGFSTAMQQAQQAGTAATANQAAQTRAGILSQNYQQERQLQQGAVGLGESLVAQPSTYLGQVNQALYAPYQQQAQITTGLLGNNPYSPQPTYVQQPNIGNAIGTGIQSAQGIYSLYNSINGPSAGGGGYTPVEGSSPTSDSLATDFIA
jgi:hypothetical protein